MSHGCKLIVSERIVEKIIILIEKTSEGIMASEEISKYFICRSHIEIIEVT